MNTATDDCTRTAPDALTIAYLAIGAASAINARGSLPSAVSDAFGGQLGFIEDVTDHALMLDTMADDLANDMDGVFLYEIAEPFGEEYAERLIAYTTGEEANAPDPRTLAMRLFAEMARAGSCQDCVAR